LDQCNKNTKNKKTAQNKEKKTMSETIFFYKLKSEKQWHTHEAGKTWEDTRYELEVKYKLHVKSSKLHVQGSYLVGYLENTNDKQFLGPSFVVPKNAMISVLRRPLEKNMLPYIPLKYLVGISEPVLVVTHQSDGYNESAIQKKNTPPVGYHCFGCGAIDHYKNDCPLILARMQRSIQEQVVKYTKIDSCRRLYNTIRITKSSKMMHITLK
jgi:hypothetical protein